MARQGRLGQPETRAHRARAVLVAKLARLVATVPVERRGPPEVTVLWVKRVTMELMGSREQRAIVVQQAQPGRPEARAIKAKAVLVERLALRAATALAVTAVRRGRQGLQVTRVLKA